jgi:hypothetical protein
MYTHICIYIYIYTYTYTHTPSEDEADIILELDGNQGGGEGYTATVLAREGTQTRFELMMSKDHLQQNSFLEYHVVCLEVCMSGFLSRLLTLYL